MTTTVCGVDPGLNGAFAFLDTASGKIAIYDMPTVSDGKKRHTDPTGVAQVLSANPATNLAVVEHVTSSPQMGVASSFSFGRTLGVVLGSLARDGVSVLQVRPNIWKPKLGCTADKKQTVGQASKLLPGASAGWPLAKHDGRAEAALLALYGAISLGLRLPPTFTSTVH